MPMETDTLEFNANVRRRLVFSLSYSLPYDERYGQSFTYENQAPNPLIPNPKLAQRKLFADDRKFHFMADKMILLPTETMEWQCYKTHDGVLAQNGV